MWELKTTKFKPAKELVEKEKTRAGRMKNTTSVAWAAIGTHAECTLRVPGCHSYK